jgi:16S rRNA (guanine527-N7)-methyltransferase
VTDTELPDQTVLARGARELGIGLAAEQIRRFAQYQTELLAWNERFNLTAITEPSDVQVKHFLDSLTVLKALPPPGKGRLSANTLLDVGSGAGFPGIPLAIVRPGLRVVLLETTQKKCAFLEHVVAQLGLENVRVRNGRAEDLAYLPGQRESYDVVVSRAVGALATLAELCLPFARVGGRMIAPKKLGIDDEVAAARNAITKLGGRLAPEVIVRLPVLDEERQLLIVEKVRPTPIAYPRRAPLPERSPL